MGVGSVAGLSCSAGFESSVSVLCLDTEGSVLAGRSLSTDPRVVSMELRGEDCEVREAIALASLACSRSLARFGFGAVAVIIAKVSMRQSNLTTERKPRVATHQRW